MELFRPIRYLLNRRRLQREMADEMAYHRELMPVDRQREFGNDLRLLERSREVWGWAWLDHLCQDLTYGSRVLRRSPDFTLTAVLVPVGRDRRLLSYGFPSAPLRHEGQWCA